MRKFMIFDTETTGLPVRGADVIDKRQPRIVQFAALMMQEDGRILHEVNLTVKSDIPIPAEASRIHGITDEVAAQGVDPLLMVVVYEQLAKQADMLVAHNAAYDLPRLEAATVWCNREWKKPPRTFCTMQYLTPVMKLPGRHGYKWPRLSEAYRYMFKKDMENAHDAMGDVRATAQVFLNLLNEDGFILP